MIDYDQPVDLSKLDMDDLQAAFVQSGADLVTISNRRDQLLQCMESRKAQAVAKARVSALSPLERDALKAELDTVTPEPAVPVAVQTIDP